MAHAARCPNLRSLAAECRKPYGFDGRGHWLKRLLFVKTAWNIKRRRTNNGLGDFSTGSLEFLQKWIFHCEIIYHVGGVPSISCGLLSTR